MELALLSLINIELVARRACVVVTSIVSGESSVVLEADASSDTFATQLMNALATNKSGMIEVDGAKFFLTVYVPPVRILILGAVHISQALAPMAQRADFDVSIIDPRTAFATSERFSDVTVIADWPDLVLPKLGLDRYTAFVALTHDPKIDDMGLRLALRSDCFYIGALGSRKSHVKRLARLQGQGSTEAETNRIRSPVGLNIGAVTPAEIAVSILAEIIATLRVDRVALKGDAGQSLHITHV